jgi:hypothetical protein
MVRAPSFSPLQVIERYRDHSVVEEAWLQRYVDACERAEFAVANGIIQNSAEVAAGGALAADGAAYIGTAAEGASEVAGAPVDVQRAAHDMLTESVHGDVEAPATGRPRRKAARAMQAYVRIGAVSGLL